jgi:hypothetical protein
MRHHRLLEKEEFLSKQLGKRKFLGADAGFCQCWIAVTAVDMPIDHSKFGI